MTSQYPKDRAVSGRLDGKGLNTKGKRIESFGDPLAKLGTKVLWSLPVRHLALCFWRANCRSRASIAAPRLRHKSYWGAFFNAFPRGFRKRVHLHDSPIRQ